MRSALLGSRGRAGQSMTVRASSEEAVALAPRATPYKLQGPDPKKFGVGDGQLFAITGAAMAPLMRLGTGVFNYGYKVSLQTDDGKYAVLRPGGRKVTETSLVSQLKRPAQTLELYEFEGCPFCKKVREAVSILDLDVVVRPTPQNGPTWRPKAIAMGGKRQFPFLVDPNTGRQVYESDEIIKYLYNNYGPGESEIPFMLRAGFLTALTCGLGLMPRIGAGNGYRPSRLPEQPLRMWMYDGSPFVKVVREVLCELELPYLQKTAARGSPKRQELLDTYGHFQVPFLEDPNTGVAMFESKAIIEYLRTTYGVKA